jgi:regulator of replication initiation timing
MSDRTREAIERIERIAVSEPTNEREDALRESLAVLVARIAELEVENHDLRWRMGLETHEGESTDD